MRLRRKPEVEMGEIPLRTSPRGRVGDVVPDATDLELLHLYGPDAHEVIAFRALLRRMRASELAGDRDEEGRLRIGENYFRYAAGEISGRDLCEAERLADYEGREDEVSEETEGTQGGGEAENQQGPPPLDQGAGAAAEGEAEQGRRDLEAALESGELSLEGLFVAADEETERGHRIAGHMHLKRALVALPHIGEIRANEILDALNLDGTEHIDQLGTQQQAALVEAVKAES